MVIYLEEAVERKREELAGAMTIEGLREAVMEGALLRLRPKVMTVSTVIAGLLPIMWSTHTGADVMKPLATPVLGGMVSSLLHVLIVTPVIFFWIRQRQMGLVEAKRGEGRGVRWIRFAMAALGAVVVIAGAWAVWNSVVRPNSGPESTSSADVVRTV